MSDAIVLDVLSSSPVQLDVGDADPIAREEIAALAGRVTTVEGDVSGLSTRMGAAEGDISTLGTTVDGIDARVEAIEADYVTSEDVMGALGGEAPTLVAGSATGILGDTETASWMERTTAADGAALIEAIYGNTIVQDGSLLPVRMEGVETVGFNLWDEEWELGSINANTGANILSNTTIRCKNYVHVLPGQTYYFNGRAYFWAYDADKSYVGRIDHGGIGGTNSVYNNTITVPNGINFLRFVLLSNYGTTYNHDICINLSDPSRNGTYEPYWHSERVIPASTYFPDGMRSAGSVRDELRADAAVTRVGERAYQSGDESDASVVTDGTVTHYALATPTTTPIDPPLNMTYRAENGGTETITHTEQSAPPVLSIAYGHTAEGIVQQAASAIAAQDGPTATTNHAVGSYLTMGGTLYRVTTAIATGEAITPGTNVTATTVMAEVLSLIQ